MQLHVHLVVIHLAIEHQLIGRSALKTKVGLPVLVSKFCEREGVVAHIDRGAVGSKRLVHTLEGHAFLEVKNGAAEAIVVSHQGRTNLAVNRKLIDVPDAVEHGLRSSTAIRMPGTPRAIEAAANHPETKNNLNRDCDATGGERLEEFRGSRGCGGAIA